MEGAVAEATKKDRGQPPYSLSLSPSPPVHQRLGESLADRARQDVRTATGKDPACEDKDQVSEVKRENRLNTRS